ncbi:hypothetical protein BD560DRAFT_415479 [Blakeslea trispora]|nr:hypothetical protein BD560DRAFT_415479 [Blakeslea trispora]
MLEDKVELDIELDAPIEADQNEAAVGLKSAESLFEDEDVKEHEYEFEGIPRPSVLFLQGVDDLSTAEITSHVNSTLLQKVQWINDASCNLVFESQDQATEAARLLLKDPSNSSLDHLTLQPAKPFIKDDRSIDLFIRIATDEDVKERGSREKSRYYQLHGVENETRRQTDRRMGRIARAERMTRNGGDGRDVFSRLGNRVPRRRSQSPSRETTRTSERERSVEREIPQHLKDRLGPRREDN